MLTKKIQRDLVVIISVTFGLLLGVSNISADTTPYTDSDGSVTGQVNATYYKVTNWKDIFDCYKAAADNQTVYLSVQNDIAGSSDFNSGSNGKVTSGKSVDILGNHHKIYADNNTDYSTATSRVGRGSGGYGFYANSSNVTETTEMRVENATIINNHADGIFTVTGSSTATTTYKNVHTMNGAVYSGAGPIRNEQGTIKFMGNNVFNILQDQPNTDLGSGSNIDMSQTKTRRSSGYDGWNQGEWIQGGQKVEVVNGETTLNDSWLGKDQPFYIYYTKNGSSLSIDSGAKLNWNLNQTYALWYDNGNTLGPLSFNIGKNSQFNIHGTQNTASTNKQWFSGINTLNSFIVNMDESSLFDVATAGGSINLDGFRGGESIINVAKDSKMDIFNLNSGTSLFSGKLAKGSAINLNDPNSVTLKTMGGSVFQSGTDIPINISGAGLRLHASKSVDANLGTDLYKRMTTGTTDGNFTSANMAPIPYTADDLSFLRQAKYIQWSRPQGSHMLNGSLDRTFAFNVQDCPQNGLGGLASEGGYFVGQKDNDMHFNFCADEGTKPNVKIQVAVNANRLPQQTAYYWRNAGENNAKELSNEPYTILSVTDDEKLPQGVTMKKAGEEYDVTFKKNDGLLLKAGNGIPVEDGSIPQASFTYSMVDAQ